MELEPSEDMEFEDETLSERLWALTEMFPAPVRNLSSAVVDNSVSLGKTLFSWSRTGLWVAATSVTILILPLIIEQERSTIEEQQNLQQRQLLLGPSAASTSPQAGPSSAIPFGLAASPIK